jgi:3-hydroxyisobutyrate dehydrogenase-like beta-hydroxyacid dehydrogenase
MADSVPTAKEGGALTESSSRVVGMVGLGAMGRPIIEHIAKAGFRALAYDLSPSAEADGVTLVSSLADLAPCDVVIVIVPTDKDVAGVVAGPGGLLDHGKPGLTVVISASVDPATCRQLAARAEEHQIRVIDAALTGGVRGAQNGEINLLVGGPREVADAISDVFAAFATDYHVLGDVGAGQIGKSANNLIHWAQIVAINESMRLAEDLGVDPAALRGALEQGPTDSRTLREIEYMRFTWYVKDIEIAQDLASRVGRDLPLARLSRELMDQISVASIHELLRIPPSPGSRKSGT